MVDLTYDGNTLTWISNGNKKYKATSGLPTLTNKKTFEEEPAQYARFSNRENGPIPAGSYHVSVFMNGTAKLAHPDRAPNQDNCGLAPSSGGIEDIPDKGYGRCAGWTYGGWGYHRIRVFKDRKSQSTRDNFYLHDSRKGYSHGCIETEGSFFDDLKKMAEQKRISFTLTLQVHYKSGDTSTNGGTKQ